jgi:ribonuclease HI
LKRECSALRLFYKGYLVKKYQQSLAKIQKSLQEHDLLTAPVREALELLDHVVRQLPEEKRPGKEGLGVPKEIKDDLNGLALYTDGACRGNPGPGAWACVAQNQRGEIVFESCGHEVQTTNNKMEIQAVIGAFQQLENFLLSHPLHHFKPIYLYTDSKYVCDGLNQWVTQWKSRGWKKADGKGPENLELWQELDGLKNKLSDVQVRWVKGHSGHPQNEYCDYLANRLLDEEGF